MKKLLSMAALALVGAMMTGCSSDDEFQQPENKSNLVTLKTTVGLDGGATTRALDPTTRAKTFAAGETMAIVYKNTNGAYVKAVSAALTDGDIMTTDDEATNKKSATFTFTLENPDMGKNVNYVYPAAMATASALPFNLSVLYTEQDGTLAKLASTFDLSVGSGSWGGDGNLPSVTLYNQLAILAITLKNSDGSSDITSSITGLTITQNSHTYTINRDAAEGPIYVAIIPESGNVTITATDGTNNYAKTLNDKSYEPSNGYNVSWRMATTVTWNFSELASEYAEWPYYGGVQLMSGENFVHEGVTLSYEGSQVCMLTFNYGMLEMMDGTATFTAPSGKKFTSIVINCENGNLGGDFERRPGSFTWTGNSETVTFGGGGTDASDITSIVFTLVDAPAPTAYTLAESTQGMIVGTNGMAYDVADLDNLPTGVTAAGVVVYKSANAGESLAIALEDEASMMDWATAKGASGAAAHTPAVEGYSWKLPSLDDWTLVASANSGSSLNNAITSAGGTAILTLQFDLCHRLLRRQASAGPAALPGGGARPGGGLSAHLRLRYNAAAVLQRCCGSAQISR